jgi:hypothetical protein
VSGVTKVRPGSARSAHSAGARSHVGVVAIIGLVWLSFLLFLSLHSPLRHNPLPLNASMSLHMQIPFPNTSRDY